MVATIDDVHQLQADDRDIVCLLIWQEVFHSTPPRVAVS